MRGSRVVVVSIFPYLREPRSPRKSIEGEFGFVSNFITSRLTAICELCQEEVEDEREGNKYQRLQLRTAGTDEAGSRPGMYVVVASRE